MDAATVIKLGAAQTQSLCFDFPLRADFLAQLVVPRNITSLEAARLCAFITTLAEAGTCKCGAYPWTEEGLQSIRDSRNVTHTKAECA